MELPIGNNAKANWSGSPAGSPSQSPGAEQLVPALTHNDCTAGSSSLQPRFTGQAGLPLHPEVLGGREWAQLSSSPHRLEWISKS